MKGKTWIEINRTHLQENCRQLQLLCDSGAIKTLAVVKSNAYGCGMVETAGILEDQVDWFGVDDIEEALLLREGGITKPVLVFGYIPDTYLGAAADHDITVTLSSIERLGVFASTPDLQVHIKVDTGLHRQGFTQSDRDILREWVRLHSGKVTGLYTHFAIAEDPTHIYTDRQILAFRHWKEDLDLGGHVICHAGATSGVVIGEKCHLDMVRLGIGLYGLWPDPKLQAYLLEHGVVLNLQPVLSWKVVISEMHTVVAGERMGYNLSGVVQRDSLVGILPVGYWHGYPRLLGNKAKVFIHGKRAPILGNICMDMCMVDLTDIEGVQTGDPVELLGENVTAEEFAGWAETINYEAVTRLHPAIERRVVQ
jgi:alanine racemase